jgi:hypothetical protein
MRTRKLAVFVTCLGVAAAFPVLSSADKGGVPNSHSNSQAKKEKKDCPTKGKGVQHQLPPQAEKGKGKKCGHKKQPNGQQQTTTVPSGSTSTETETETTTTDGTTTI